MRTLAALFVAAAMVVAAVMVRSALTGGEGSGRGTASDTPPAPAVVCAPEVAEACTSRWPDATVADPGTTAAGLATVRAPDPVWWVVPAVWPAMVEAGRARAGLPPAVRTEVPTGVGTDVVMVAEPGRLAALERSCGVRWSCVGDLAGRPWSDVGGDTRWGPVKPGHPPPDTDTGGLLVLAQIAADRLGTVDLSAADLRDPGFVSWLGGLERAVRSFRPPAGTPLEAMVLASGQFDVVGDLGARAGRLLSRAARGGALETAPGGPPVSVEVVVAVTGDAPVPDDGVVEALAGDLAALGFQPGTTSRHPDPGVLEALTALWAEVAR